MGKFYHIYQYDKIEITQLQYIEKYFESLLDGKLKLPQHCNGKSKEVLQCHLHHYKHHIQNKAGESPILPLSLPNSFCKRGLNSGTKSGMQKKNQSMFLIRGVSRIVKRPKLETRIVRQMDKRRLQIYKGYHMKEQFDFFPLMIPRSEIKTIDRSYRKMDFGSMSGEKNLKERRGNI